MWNDKLPAKLPAKPCPPVFLPVLFGELKQYINQWVMPVFLCPPKPTYGGELETQQNQILKPAAQTLRLTTCARFGEHIVCVQQKGK